MTRKSVIFKSALCKSKSCFLVLFEIEKIEMTNFCYIKLQTLLYTLTLLSIAVNRPYANFPSMYYGNTGCGVFKGGIQNWKVFWLKINCS